MLKILDIMSLRLIYIFLINLDLELVLSTQTCLFSLLMPIFANSYPKAHMEESPMKSKTQRPANKTKEQERSKERNARKSNLQQNTNL